MPRERRQKGWVHQTGKKVKTWTGYWYEYILEDGIERRVGPKSKVLGKKADKTKGQAQDALQDHLKTVLLAGGAPKANTNIKTFQDAADHYLKVKRPEWDPGFHGSMTSIFKVQINKNIGTRPIREIVNSELKLMLGNIKGLNGTEASESLLKKIRSHVYATFEMLVEDGLLFKNPARKLKLPNHKAKDETYHPMPQIHTLLITAKLQSNRDYLIVKIAVVLGLRPSELFALRKDDISTGFLHIDEKVVRTKKTDKGGKAHGPKVSGKLKTLKSKAFLPLPPDLEHDLRAYMEKECITHSPEFLFPNEIGTAMDPDHYLDRVLKPLAEKAGIGRTSFQILRRSCSTNFGQINKGQIKDSQELMRHEDAATTLNNYEKPVEQSLIDAVGKYNEAVNAGLTGLISAPDEKYPLLYTN